MSSVTLFKVCGRVGGIAWVAADARCQCRRLVPCTCLPTIDCSRAQIPHFVACLRRHRLGFALAAAPSRAPRHAPHRHTHTRTHLLSSLVMSSSTPVPNLGVGVAAMKLDVTGISSQSRQQEAADNQIAVRQRQTDRQECDECMRRGDIEFLLVVFMLVLFPFCSFSWSCRTERPICER